jgi:hypothetical protein
MTRLALALCLALPAGAPSKADAPKPLPFISELDYQIIADVPLALRVDNWTSERGAGSCVNASTIVCLNWAGLEATADWWPWSGGETKSSCTQHLAISRVDYCVADGGGEDAVNLLRWASRNRIPVGITFKSRHFCTLLDFNNGGYCVVLDNNNINGFEVYTTDEFLEMWRLDGEGGYAAVIVSPPPPPWPE